MSVSRNQKRKAEKKLLTPEVKKIQRQIRSGELPRYHFAKPEGGSIGTNALERTPKFRRVGKYQIPKMKLTWRLVSTLAALIEKETP